MDNKSESKAQSIDASETQVRHATKADIPQVSKLFDLYRQFYQCDADINLATGFISERIENDDSIIFVVQNEKDNLVGFTQLYPSLCSVDVCKIFILYDLYIDEENRKLGLGAKLMNAAKAFAITQGAKRIDLLTAHSNTSGQRLYENLGYEKVLDDFFSYSLTL